MRKIFLALVIFILGAAAPVCGLPLLEGPLLPEHEVYVILQPAERTLTGRVRVILPVEKQYTVDVGQLRVTGVALNGKLLNVSPKNGVFTIGPTAGVLAIGFEGMFPGEEAKAESPGVISEGIISQDGVFLTGGWYPVVRSDDRLSFYRLTVDVPDGYYPVSENEEMRVESLTGGQTRYVFRFRNPLPALSLAAGKYSRNADFVGDTVIYSYFFPGDAHLADIYLEQAKKYIRFYEEILGEFPYRHFFIVENVLPESRSLPTMAMLGWDVVRRPFLGESSFARNVLRQWIGDSLYVDDQQGDWETGLTAYLSDHLFASQKGKGAAYRKKALVTYHNYAQGAAGLSLTERSGPGDSVRHAMAEGKGLMFFHMLNREVGKDRFFEALRSFVKRKRFHLASWRDVREAFEVASNMKLEEFFSQWVERPGHPSFSVSRPHALLLGGEYRVEFTVRQQGRPYRFQLPVAVQTAEGPYESVLSITERTQHVAMKVPSRPASVAIDLAHDVMRTLREDEMPPVFSAVLGSPERIAAVPRDKAERDKYASFLEALGSEGFALRPEEELTDAEIRGASVVVMGQKSPVLGRLYAGDGPFREALKEAGRPLRGEALFSLVVRKNPLNARRAVAVVQATEAFQVLSASRRVLRNDASSVSGYNDGDEVLSYSLPSRYGMQFDLSMRAAAVAPQSGISLDEVIGRVIDAPVIYVGEDHLRYQDHQVQLAVIQALRKAGRPFGVAMQMFQRPFQGPLDEYVGGNIGEKELLKQTEYFRRWGYDYQLYREILDFARTNGIPVVAMDQKAEIIKKVSEGGLGALSEQERRQYVPDDMDFSDAGYRERLRDLYGRHDDGDAFVNFYQAQVLWDESMAHAVGDFFREYPGHQLVVLAGSSHVAFGSGIPLRAYRLTGKRYAVLLSSSGVDGMVPGIADYVVFAEPMQAPDSERLGLSLEKVGPDLLVKEVMADSPAEAAGVLPGDILVAAGGADIEDVSDLRIVLLDKLPGETLALKIKRKASWGRDAVMEFVAVFP